MSITIYHNPRCSKSRQTLQLIHDAGQTATVIEYLKTPPDEATLKAVLKKLGIKARDLLRTSEKEYKALGLDQPDVTEQTIIDAMLKHPILMQRPIVVSQNKAIIGRPPENVLSILDAS